MNGFTALFKSFCEATVGGIPGEMPLRNSGVRFSMFFSPVNCQIFARGARQDHWLLTCCCGGSTVTLLAHQPTGTAASADNL